MKYYNDADEPIVLIGHKFTNKEDINSYFSGDRIRCLICGKWLKAVSGMHLKMHGITVDKYKSMFGLPHGKGLVCGETSRKQKNALVKRIEQGDSTLTTITPELMYKAQHSPKRKYPSYHLKDLAGKYGDMGREVLTSKSKERVENIDWDSFLAEIKKSGRAIWSFKNKSGMPTYYDLQKKISEDPKFKQRYDDAVRGNKIKYSKSDAVLKLRKTGHSMREIALLTGISLTHVKRMVKERQATHENIDE